MPAGARDVTVIKFCRKIREDNNCDDHHILLLGATEKRMHVTAVTFFGSRLDYG